MICLLIGFDHGLQYKKYFVQGNCRSSYFRDYLSASGNDVERWWHYCGGNILAVFLHLVACFHNVWDFLKTWSGRYSPFFYITCLANCILNPKFGRRPGLLNILKIISQINLVRLTDSMTPFDCSNAIASALQFSFKVAINQLKTNRHRARLRTCSS